MDYITVISGDDTNFLEDQFIVVNFKTDFDMSGFTATFTLDDVTLTYGNLSEKKLEIILSKEITSNLKIGKQYGELKLIDTKKRIRTITSVIPFIVKNGVNEQITYINNSLNITTNINDTTLEIIVETAGIAKTEAEKFYSDCNEASQIAKNCANISQTLSLRMDEQVSIFTAKQNELNEAVNNSVELCQQNLTDIESAGNSALNKIYNLSTKSLNDISASQEIALNSISDEKDKADNLIKTGIKNINQGISDINEGLDNISNAEIRALEDIDAAKKQAVEDLGNIANVDFSAYALNSDLSEVAKSGDYYDLKNLPTNLSDFQNDAGYLTEHQDISGKANISDLAAVATSGDYADLDNKPLIPKIPKNISSFTNDSGYQTAAQVNSLISALNNIKSLSSSGTISLTDNTIHRITVTGTVTFSLPSSLSSSLFHQMLVQLYMASVYTINLGTSKYFSNESPDLKTAGYYNIIYEHNGSSWVVGAIYKGK